MATPNDIYTELKTLNAEQGSRVIFSVVVNEAGAETYFALAGIAKIETADPDECLAWVQTMTGKEGAYEKILKERELAELTEKQATLTAKIAELEGEISVLDAVVVDA